VKKSITQYLGVVQGRQFSLSKKLERWQWSREVKLVPLTNDVHHHEAVVVREPEAESGQQERGKAVGEGGGHSGSEGHRVAHNLINP
jgi:hypothetical protein